MHRSDDEMEDDDSFSSGINFDLKFEMEDGTKFDLEKVNYYSTVELLKDLIRELTGIPVHHQILIFNGNTLDDDDVTIEQAGIEPNSIIQLIVDDPGRGSEPSIAELLVKLPNNPDFTRFPMVNSHSVLQLKQIVQHTMNPMFPVSRMGLYYHNNSIELQDDKQLCDYGLLKGSKLDLYIKPSLTPIGASEENLLTIQVITPCQKKLYLQVDRTHKVKVLRDELERIQPREKFELPTKYFFLHEEGNLDEEVSFKENLVYRFDEIHVVQEKSESLEGTDNQVK